ncbi:MULTISPECIES: hypothetical protein [unclassified Aminobacter]|uniref:hypothetical protein n=1 Tax=unclassified Aminobacter TaxID=2644704 RepID=UPI0011A0E3DC|nr:MULTISPECIES: hypothetical protein [unclassified Aminobacter]
MEKANSPLETIIDEIDRALDSGFYYLAVAATLTLPDICVSLVDGDRRKKRGERYAKWCDKNLGDNFAYVTGNDLWSLRCGASHSGRFGGLDHNVGRVIFSLPGTGVFVNCLFNDAYFYSVSDFCRNFMADVRKWYAKHADDENVRKHMERMVQYRPDGIAPYVEGAPVLA